MALGGKRKRLREQKAVITEEINKKESLIQKYEQELATAAGVSGGKNTSKIDAINKVNSIENYLELMATKTKELGIKISSTPSSPLSTPREAPIELNQISTI